MNTALLQQATTLDLDEQIELVEAIWDNIASHNAAPALYRFHAPASPPLS